MYMYVCTVHMHALPMRKSSPLTAFASLLLLLPFYCYTQQQGKGVCFKIVMINDKKLIKIKKITKKKHFTGNFITLL